MLVLPPLVVKSLKANHTYGIFLLFANLQQKKNTKIKQIKQPHAASFCCLPICNQKKEYKNKTTTCGIFSLFANLQPKMKQIKQIKQIKQMKQPHVASFCQSATCRTRPATSVVHSQTYKRTQAVTIRPWNNHRLHSITCQL